MTAHSNEHNMTQHLSMYGVTVVLRQTRLYEVEVSFEGGMHNDGSEVKSFANMAEALSYVAELAEELEEDEGDDWGVEEAERREAAERYARVVSGTGNATERRELDALCRGLRDKND